MMKFKWSKDIKKKKSGNLAIRKMQIKITAKFHFTPVRMAIIKKSGNS